MKKVLQLKKIVAYVIGLFSFFIACKIADVNTAGEYIGHFVVLSFELAFLIFAFFYMIECCVFYFIVEHVKTKERRERYIKMRKNRMLGGM